ncbi:hypothetical protein HK096_005374, partial [Nowakowskiella sp. JEL0078]
SDGSLMRASQCIFVRFDFQSFSEVKQMKRYAAAGTTNIDRTSNLICGTSDRIVKFTFHENLRSFGNIIQGSITNNTINKK